MIQQIGRGEFLKRISGLSVILLLDRERFAFPATDPLPHPEPRSGISADNVLNTEDRGDKRQAVIEAYDAARHYPQVFDGLACGCGCHGDASYQHRSLLVCYETKQPTGCPSCRSEATFVGTMVKDGRTLAEIRASVDKKFG